MSGDKQVANKQMRLSRRRPPVVSNPVERYRRL